MSPRVLFEQDLETLKNKVSEMGEHAEISYGYGSQNGGYAEKH